MAMRYRALLAHYSGEPLLIQPAKARALLAVLGVETEGERLAAPGEKARPSGLQIIGSTAILAINGTLLNGPASSLDALSGITSYGQIRADLQEAMANDQVERIVLKVNSRGGEAHGAFDLADQIRAARETKRIIGYGDVALSGGYLLLCQAHEVVTSQSSSLGSVGVYLARVDQTRVDERVGVVVHEFTSGARKADGSPHREISKEEATAIQGRVDALASLFHNAVAAGREALSPAMVRAQEAGVFLGQQAVEERLADRVMSWEAFMETLEAETMSETETETPEAPVINESAQDQTPTEVMEAFLAEHPEAAELLRVQGLEAERERVASLRSHALPGFDELLEEHIGSGAKLEDFLVAQTRAARENPGRMVAQDQDAALREASTGVEYSEPAGQASAAAAAPTTWEAKAKAAWNASAELQEKYCREYEVFLHSDDAPARDA
jgi:signal peptide peptidase SppA